MNHKVRDTVARNLRALMKHYGYTQMQLSQKAGVHQKTISNILNPEQIKGTATLGSIEKVAGAFSMDMWQICVPEVALELLISHDLEKLVDNYINLDMNKQREVLSNMAQHQAAPSLETAFYHEKEVA